MLIIEDEEGAARTLEKFFAKKGYSVRISASGEDGLAQFQTRTPEVVLLDFKLPGMDGEQVFLKLKEINPLIPVIIMTAFGEVDLAVRLLKLGVFYFITKPFELDILLHLVQEAMGKIAPGPGEHPLAGKIAGPVFIQTISFIVRKSWPKRSIWRCAWPIPRPRS